MRSSSSEVKSVCQSWNAEKMHQSMLRDMSRVGIFFCWHNHVSSLTDSHVSKFCVLLLLISFYTPKLTDTSINFPFFQLSTLNSPWARVYTALGNG